MDHEDERFFVSLRLRIYRSITPDTVARLETITINSVGDLITVFSPYDIGQCIERDINLTEEVELSHIQRALFRCWTSWLNNEVHLSKVSKRIIKVTEVLSAICRIDCLARFISSRSDVCGIMGSEMYGELGSDWKMSDLIRTLKSKRLIEAELLQEVLRKLNVREELPKAETREKIAIALRRQYFKKLKEVVTPLKDRNLMNAVSLIWLIETIIKPDLRNAMKNKRNELPKSFWRLGNKVANAIWELSGNDISIAETLVSNIPAFILHYRFRLLPVGPSTMIHYFVTKCWETFFVSHIIYSVLKGAPPEYIKRWIRRWGALYERLYS